MTPTLKALARLLVALLPVAAFIVCAAYALVVLADPPPGGLRFAPVTLGAVAVAVIVFRARTWLRALLWTAGVGLGVAAVGDRATIEQVTYGACLAVVTLAGIGVILFVRSLVDARRGAEALSASPHLGAHDVEGVLAATEEPLIIGLCGYAGSGKDTAAQGLLWTGEWAHASFAAKLKDFLAAANPLVPVYRGMPGYEAFNLADTEPVHVRYSEYVEEVGLETAKENPEVRALLQRVGTDAGRKVLGEDVWVDAALNDLPMGHVVFTDVRFPNEAAAIQDAGGYIIRVNRPGHGPANGHVSETALDGFPFDAEITNSGSRRDLHAALNQVIATLEWSNARQTA